jgi:hypothetical protein
MNGRSLLSIDFSKEISAIYPPEISIERGIPDI